MLLILCPSVRRTELTPSHQLRKVASMKNRAAEETSVRGRLGSVVQLPGENPPALCNSTTAVIFSGTT